MDLSKIFTRARMGALPRVAVPGLDEEAQARIDAVRAEADFWVRQRKGFAAHGAEEGSRRLPEGGRRVTRLALFVPFLLLALFMGGMAATGYYDDEVSTCTVASKDRVWKSDGNGGGSSEARVYTEECGTFVVGDSLVKMEFSSADTFGAIDEGGRYEFTHHGWRFGLFSMFPTITEAEPVS